MDRITHALYDFDPQDQCYVIKLSPDRHMDIFNNLDHYPIRKRDVNQHVVNYIEDCSSDIPLKYKLKIEIKIKKESPNQDLEQRIVRGMKNYFLYIAELYKKNSRSEARNSLLFGLIFTILTTFTFWLESQQIVIDQIFFKTILEGLSIGSWIFLWEAIAGLAIKNRSNRYLIRTYRRLLHSKIYFIYQEW
jgi:hypothetical protein